LKPNKKSGVVAKRRANNRKAAGLSKVRKGQAAKHMAKTMPRQVSP
jgi:hypothetical protein